MALLQIVRRVATGEPFRLAFTSDNEADIAIAYKHPGATRGHGRISYPLDVDVVDWVQQHIPHVEFTDELLEWVSKFQQAKNSIQGLTRKKYERVIVDLPYASKLYDYQTVGVKWLVDRKRGILADEPGLGKTIQGLAAADLAGAKRVLIFTVNLTVQNQWHRTIQTWKLGSSVVVTGTAAQRNALLNEKARFYVCPVGMLSAMKTFPSLAGKWDCIILDEAHMYQGRDSARGKAAAKLKSEYMFLLTGTPVWNKLPSLWNLLHIIDKARWSSYWLWINRYFQVWESPFGQQIGKPRKEMEPALKGEIQEILLRRELVEVFKDFPVAHEHVIEVELGDISRAGYKHIRSRIASYQDVEVAGRRIEITSKVQAIPILRSFLNYLDRDVAMSGGSNGKLFEIMRCIAQASARGLQSLIFTWHTEYADYLATQIKDARATHGKKPPQERAQCIEDFKTKKFPVLIASMASMGVGVDLPDVDVLIFAECDYVPATIEQSWRRIYRVTSTRQKLIIYIYYKDTIEEVIYKNFNKKQALSDEMLADQILRD